jgi:hypothetical protein
LKKITQETIVRLQKVEVDKNLKHQNCLKKETLARLMSIL